MNEKITISETSLYNVLFSIIEECFDEVYVEEFQEHYIDSIKKTLEKFKIKQTLVEDRRTKNIYLISSMLLDLIKKALEEEK